MGSCFGCCQEDGQRRMSCWIKQTDIQDEYELGGVPGDSKKVVKQEAHLIHLPHIMNPSKYIFKKSHLYWLNRDNQSANENSAAECLSPTDAVPLLQRDESLTDISSQKLEFSNANYTPASSVDLEWENEIGLTPPPNMPFPTGELAWLTNETNSNHSHPSSPLSHTNGLEWDGDFISVHMSDITAETEQLINDIEEMAARALSDTDPSR